MDESAIIERFIRNLRWFPRENELLEEPEGYDAWEYIAAQTRESPDAAWCLITKIIRRCETREVAWTIGAGVLERLLIVVGMSMPSGSQKRRVNRHCFVMHCSL